MALTGTFIADFQSFYAATQKAEVSLRGFETGAGKVEKSLNRVANSLSGTKIIQEATLAAQAVEKIGGVSKLTEAELRRVGATAQEAAAKLRAMGQDVPPGIQRIADATKGANAQSGAWIGTLTKMAGAIGIAFSVGAVINFGKSVFDAASQVKDMASKLGISTDAVQGFKFAAEQTGSSLDAVGTAINKMNANLAGGDKATVQALKDAGLSFADIRAMQPEEAFLAISDAIQRIPDPMTQSDVAMQLFGRSAAELLPGMKEGFRTLADSADKMSEDTIKSLEEAQDAWEAFGNKVTIVTGTLLADLMKVPDAVRRVTSSFAELAAFAADMAVNGIGAATQHVIDLNKAQKQSKDVHLGLVPVIAAATSEHVKHAAAVKKSKEATQAFSLEVKNSLYGIGELGRHLGKQIDMGVAPIVPIMEATADATVKALRAFWDLSTKVDVLIPKAAALGVSLKTNLVDTLKSIPQTLADAFTGGGGIMGGITAIASKIGSQIGSSIGFAVGGPMGASIGAALGSLAGSLSKYLKPVYDALTNLSTKWKIALTALVPPLGILSWFSSAEKKVNDIRDAFLLTFGPSGLGAESGFNQLAAQLHMLGESGDALFQRLINAKKVDEFQSAMQAVNEALAKQEQAQDAVTVQTEEGAQATIETAAQAALALDQLNGRLAVNAEHWGAWSADVTGFLQKLANDIRSMPLPGPGGAVSGTGTVTTTGGGLRAPSIAPRDQGPLAITLMMPDGDVLLRQVIDTGKSRGLMS